MGTLGNYLHEARETAGIDIRDAAQQTRISVNFLRALEAERFDKLPGEVFVKGFLKSYAKFLRLDEAEVMRKYEETRKPLVAAPAPAPAQAMSAPATVSGTAAPEPVPAAEPKQKSDKLPLGPFLWGGGIIVAVVIFLFVAMPAHRRHKEQGTTPAAVTGGTEVVTAPSGTPATEKLYLEVVALESTWILVRTDASPEKKAVLNKGESLIWSADERFVLSFGSSKAVKLVLNGQDLQVDEPKNTVVRDLIVTAKGIMNRRIQAEPVSAKTATVKPKRRIATTATPSASPITQEQKPLPKKPEPAPQQTQTKPQPLAPITIQQTPEPAAQPSHVEQAPAASAPAAPTPEPAPVP